MIIILDMACRTRSGHAAQTAACPKESLFSNGIVAPAILGELRGFIADGIAPLATAVTGVALHGVDIAVLNVIHDRISIR